MDVVTLRMKVWDENMGWKYGMKVWDENMGWKYGMKVCNGCYDIVDECHGLLLIQGNHNYLDMNELEDKEREKKQLHYGLTYSIMLL